MFAVSFDTVTYRDLQQFLAETNTLGYELSRIDPNEFLNMSEYLSGSYINIVNKDMELRQQITEKFDSGKIDRFSLIHDRSYTHAATIGLGCMIYPMVSMYTNAVLAKDNIVHSMTMIAHDCYIDIGTYISPGVSIAGTTTVGKFCKLGLGSVISDGITIVDHTVVGMGTVVRAHIRESGSYINKSNSALTKIK